MAVDFFLQISGPDIKGKSLADGFEDAIDILSWSWGCQNLARRRWAAAPAAARLM